MKVYFIISKKKKNLCLKSYLRKLKPDLYLLKFKRLEKFEAKKFIIYSLHKYLLLGTRLGFNYSVVNKTMILYFIGFIIHRKKK